MNSKTSVSQSVTSKTVKDANNLINVLFARKVSPSIPSKKLTSVKSNATLMTVRPAISQINVLTANPNSSSSSPMVSNFVNPFATLINIANPAQSLTYVRLVKTASS